MTALDPMAFADHGNCRGADQTIFFPAVNNEDAWFDALLAAEPYCLDCPVRVACHDWALHHETEGIWAATTPRQRARVRRAVGIEEPTPPPIGSRAR